MKYTWYTRKLDDGNFLGRVKMSDGKREKVIHSEKFVTRSRAETWVKNLVRYYEEGGQPQPKLRME